MLSTFVLWLHTSKHSVPCLTLCIFSNLMSTGFTKCSPSVEPRYTLLCVTTGRPVGLMFSPVWSGFPSLKRVHADELSVCRRERKQSAVSYIFGPNVAAPLTVRSTSSLHVMNSRRICHLTWMDGCTVGGCLTAPTKTVFLTQRSLNGQRSKT